MRKEDKILLAGARQDFQGEVDLDVDWELVFKLAVDHGIAPIIYENIVRGTGLEIEKKFSLAAAHNAIDKERRGRVLGDALAYFAGKSVEVMLIKGAALDVLVYERPYLTVSKDIDIILSKKVEVPHFPGIEYDFYHHHDTDINGALPVDFDRIWRDSLPIIYREHPARVMCPEDMLISLCINSCRKRFFRLKSLMDIRETSLRLPINWDKLMFNAKAYDCLPIVYTAMRVTERTLGFSVPKIKLGIRKPLIDLMINVLMRRPLSSYPFSGPNVMGRQINFASILPYMNYRGYQIWRKAQEIREDQHDKLHPRPVQRNGR